MGKGDNVFFQYLMEDVNWQRGPKIIRDEVYTKQLDSFPQCYNTFSLLVNFTNVLTGTTNKKIKDQSQSSSHQIKECAIVSSFYLWVVNTGIASSLKRIL